MQETIETLPPRASTAAAGLALVVIGGSIFNILPLLTAGAADKLGFSAQQAGALSSALTVASGLSALLAGFWVRSARWPRAAAMALGGMCLCLLAALGTRGYWLFVSMQAAAAFFGSAALSLGMTIMSDRHESERSFGTAISAQAAYQIAAIWAGSMMLAHLGQEAAASSVMRAVETVTADGRIRTPDQGGNSSTAAVGRAVMPFRASGLQIIPTT